MKILEFQNKLIQLQKQLNLFAFSLTTNAEDADDLLQETNLKALSYCDKFQRGTNFKAWTFTIMKNTFINDYRRRIHHNILNGNNRTFLLNQIKSGVTPDASSTIELKELEDNVESIDDKLRIPFKMMHEGYKYKEIADILDLNLGSVKSRIHCARQQLMHKIKRDVPNWV